MGRAELEGLPAGVEDLPTGVEDLPTVEGLLAGVEDLPAGDSAEGFRAGVGPPAIKYK